jgi:hypothetical protein
VFRRKYKSVDVSAGGECFFCGVAADPTQDDGTAFMTVVGSQTGLYGAWPVHISCVAAAEHPEAGEATVHIDDRGPPELPAAIDAGSGGEYFRDDVVA